MGWTLHDTMHVNAALRRRLFTYRLNVEFGLFPTLRDAVKFDERVRQERLAENAGKVARAWHRKQSRRTGHVAFLRNRAAVLAGNPPCAYCGAVATTVDHVVSRRRGGSNDVSNLVPACVPCNSAKGKLSVLEWRECRAARGLSWPPSWPARVRGLG